MTNPQVTLIGRLGADPELRFTPAGKAVVSFSVGVSDSKKNTQTNQWENGETTWWRCTVWEQMAENCAETLTKGMEVIVTGKAFMRSYKAKDGTDGRSLEVQVFNIGPTLKYASATVKRVDRTAATSNEPDWGAAADPWASSSSLPGQDEPPF